MSPHPSFGTDGVRGLAIVDISPEYVMALGRAIARCQHAGLFPPSDPVSDAIVVWSQMHGTTSILINDHGKYNFPWPSREALIQRSLDLIVRGLHA